MPVVARVEYASAEDLGAIQSRNWRLQREFVAARSRYYRNRGAPPLDLRDLPAYPTTDKAALREDQRADPPFGSYLAAPIEAVTRLHRTSGTTGQAMNLALSAADAAMTAIVGARSHVACGLRPGHRVVHCLNYQLWMGGLTDHLILEATGATVVPFGVGDTELLVRTIRELGIDAIYCTPSYPRRIEEVIAESFPGTRPRDLGLRIGLFAGEGGLDNPGFRARLEATWGLKARNTGYGVSDVLSTVAGQCETQNDLHLMALDVVYAELVDPDTGAPRPWAAGAQGELVLTHLEKDCQPLVRFRTGDVVLVTATERCPCGRTAPRFRVVGRSDDMVIVRGLNVFPSMVEAALSSLAELSGAYRIVLDGPGPYDRLPLHIEVADDRFLSEETAAKIARRLKDDIRVTAEIRLLPPRSLPTTAGKSKRVIRN